MSDLHSFIFLLLHYYVLIKPESDSVYIQSPNTSVQTQAYYSVYFIGLNILIMVDWQIEKLTDGRTDR